MVETDGFSNLVLGAWDARRLGSLNEVAHLIFYYSRLQASWSYRFLTSQLLME